MDAAGLRAAVADDRYWQAGHPEHDAWRAWVTDGFRVVYGGGERVSGGVVHLRAYTRSRDGRTEHVRAHLRSDPPGGGFDPGAVERAAAPLVAGVPLVIGAGGRGAGVLNNEADDTADMPADGQEAGAAAPEGERPRYIIHDGRQGKHIPGHNNHDPNRSSIAEGVDPQALADEFAGRGQRVAGEPGQSGYKERFDAGERVIGTFRDPNTGQALPTTRGMIHHAAGGRVHIVPSSPRGY
jgi:filamentous hemagglutinin